MIWQNPFAWIGLLALAVPLLVHLLARRSARVQPFPTLRFLEASRLLAPRRTRLSDLLLLVVRLGVIAAVVAALAQPLFLTGDRQRDLGRALARAIIVDTSASMLRPAEAGQRAIDVARREAGRLAGETETSVLLESLVPAHALPGALAWLGTQPRRREIVLVSDFQVGTLEPFDLEIVPARVGTRFTRIAISPRAAPIGSPERPGAESSAAGVILLLAASADSGRAEAARHAARVISTAVPDTMRPVAIVYPQYEQRARLMQAAQPVNQPWMGDVIARLRGDSTVERAARGSVGGRERLLLFSRAEPGSLASAALIAATMDALSVTPPVAELEPTTLSDEVLTQWQRPPGSVVTPRANDRNRASDGRWFWMLALLLLGIETLLRRAVPWSRRAHQSGSPDAEPAHPQSEDQRVA